MPTITIDGTPCSFEGKKYILQVAQDHGLAIPHYCYHQGLSVVASCRICLAEVAQPNPRAGNKLELIPKLMPTCQTLAADGMVVNTQSPKARANQKAVMEYLLVNHPLDCPVCDQAGECMLQDYSLQYGRAISRFEEDKIKKPVKDIGPHVKLYSDRCIMCSRCVRFTREITGTGELAVFGRGAHEQIDIAPGKALDNPLSGNVVDICPVGALLDKDFLFTQRVWFLTSTPSIDGITASGDNILIEHNNGQIYRIKPRRNLQVNKWWISDEIRYGWKFIHSQARLRTPLRQQYGTPIECLWPRAIEDARAGLQHGARKGPGSIALLVSPMLPCEHAYLLAQLVHALDPRAVIGIGPIPSVGTDQTFPGGYTISAEKCPNSRGVRRALDLALSGPSPLGKGEAESAQSRPVGSEGQTAPSAAGAPTGGSGSFSEASALLPFSDFCARLADKKTTVSAVLLTGGYPNPWVTKELTSALSKKFTVLLDILPSDLSTRADVLLPTTTWAETSGTFENHRAVLQSFPQAIAALEGSRSAAQIALDLQAACAQAPAQPPETYDPAKTRATMGGPFVSDVKHPPAKPVAAPDMVYVQL